MKTYTYKHKNVTAKISNHNGAWTLRMSVPNRVVVLANEVFPTKRAALKFAKTVFTQY